MLNMKLLEFKISFLAFLSLIGIACASQDGDLLATKVEKFGAVLLEINEKVLTEKYAGDSQSFTSEGKLHKDIYEFLYRPRDEGSDTKPVQEIIAKDKLSFKIIPQQNGVVLVLFFKEQDREKTLDIDFLENQWMRSYFACEFAVVSNELQFYQNICFAETDGPFPPGYEI